jgi:hypothetical protein
MTRWWLAGRPSVSSRAGRARLPASPAAPGWSGSRSQEGTRAEPVRARPGPDGGEPMPSAPVVTPPSGGGGAGYSNDGR